MFDLLSKAGELEKVASQIVDFIKFSVQKLNEIHNDIKRVIELLEQSRD